MTIKYQSSVATETQRKYEAEGARTVDLERKVFGDANADGTAGIRKMQAEVQRFQQEVEQISLGQYDGIARVTMIGLQRLGIPATEWMNRREGRKLERVIGDLEQRRERYETDLNARQQQIQRYLDLQDSASVLLQRYQSQIVDMAAVMEQKRADYRTAMTEAKNSDSKAYLALRLDVAHLRNDILAVRQKRDRAAAKVVETQSGIKLLSGLQDQMYAVLQKVQEAELKAKQDADQSRILDGSELSLPATVGEIATAAVLGEKVGTRARKMDALMLKTVHTIHEVKAHPMQEQDEQHRHDLRTSIEEQIDANLDAALRIAEGTDAIVH